MIGFQVLDGVIEGGLESVLLLADAVVGPLFALDHLCSELIDLRLQFGLALGRSLKTFDQVPDFLLLHGYVVLQALVLLLNHPVFVGQGIGSAAEVVRGPTELVLQVRDLPLVIRLFQLCLGLGLTELVTNLCDFFFEVLFILPED